MPLAASGPRGRIVSIQLPNPRCHTSALTVTTGYHDQHSRTRHWEREVRVALPLVCPWSWEGPRWPGATLSQLHDFSDTPTVQLASYCSPSSNRQAAPYRAVRTGLHRTALHYIAIYCHSCTVQNLTTCTVLIVMCGVVSCRILYLTVLCCTVLYCAVQTLIITNILHALLCVQCCVVSLSVTLQWLIALLAWTTKCQGLAHS